MSSGEDRRPVLSWPCQIPVDGELADVTEIASSYAGLAAPEQPAQAVHQRRARAALPGAPRDFCRTWPEQREVTVRGPDFLQQDSPDEIGRSIADWLPAIREAARREPARRIPLSA